MRNSNAGRVIFSGVPTGPRNNTVTGQWSTVSPGFVRSLTQMLSRSTCEPLKSAVKSKMMVYAPDKPEIMSATNRTISFFIIKKLNV